MVYGLDALMVEIINFFPLWHCWQYWLLVNVQVQGFGQGHGSSMLPQCTPYGEVTWRKVKVTLPIFELRAGVLCTSW